MAPAGHREIHFPQVFISEEETILPEVAVFFLSRRQLQEGDDAPDSYGDPFRGDQAHHLG